MSGNPIDFSIDEQDYILRHIGPGPAHKSWGDIARYLNRKFKKHNKGKRSRNSVWRWAQWFTSNYRAICENKVELCPVCQCQ